MLRLLAVAGLTMSMLGLPHALAQEATFYTVTYVEIGPILSKVGLAALRAYRNAGRKDKGNAGFEVFQRVDRPNQFAVIGAWIDQKAFEAHAAGDHVKEMQEKLEPMLAAPNDTRQHVGLSIAKGKSARDSVIVVTHVDVVPPQKDNAIAALKELAQESREHPGNLQFHVWQQTNRPNHFTVVESWGNRGSFDVHQMRKETRDFRAKLAAMTGALYDERIYTILR